MPASIPPPLESDHEDVHWALSTANSLHAQGDHEGALRWLQKAVETAISHRQVARAAELGEGAGQLAASLGAAHTQRGPLASDVLGAFADDDLTVRNVVPLLDDLEQTTHVDPSTRTLNLEDTGADSLMPSTDSEITLVPFTVKAAQTAPPGRAANRGEARHGAAGHGAAGHGAAGHGAAGHGAAGRGFPPEREFPPAQGFPPPPPKRSSSGGGRGSSHGEHGSAAGERQPHRRSPPGSRTLLAHQFPSPGPPVAPSDQGPPSYVEDGEERTLAMRMPPNQGEISDVDSIADGPGSQTAHSITAVPRHRVALLASPDGHDPRVMLLRRGMQVPPGAGLAVLIPASSDDAALIALLLNRKR